MTIDPTMRELVSEIEQALPEIPLTNINVRSDSWDIFEAYILSLVVTAAREEGATVTYEDVLGNAPPSGFFFRTSPVVIYSDTHPYTHAVIAFPNKPVLEAHIGVRVSGKSKILHECDVLVLYRTYLGSSRTAASLLSANLTKHRSSLAFAFSNVLS